MNDGVRGRSVGTDDKFSKEFVGDGVEVSTIILSVGPASEVVL